MPESIKRNAHAYGTRVMGEDEDIDMNKREELQYRTARYENRHEEEEEESYANSRQTYHIHLQQTHQLTTLLFNNLWTRWLSFNDS